MQGKRMIALMYEGDTVEMQWGDNEPEDGQIHGYLLVHPDGTLTVPLRNAADDPFVFVLDSSGARVVESEDQPPDASARVVWSSEGPVA